MLSMMRKCIMVKLGDVKNEEKFINFTERREGI